LRLFWAKFAINSALFGTLGNLLGCFRTARSVGTGIGFGVGWGCGRIRWRLGFRAPFHSFRFGAFGRL